MDTQFLESFVAVVDSGSMAAAARRLNLTPAGVAQRIRALEREIGAPLLSRSGRTVRPTEGGAAILGRARKFLTEVRDLKAIAANDRPSGALRLGAFHTASSGLLPDILTLLTKAYPEIEVHIIRGASAELYHKVLDDEVDAAMIAQPPFAMPKSFEWRLLREEPLIVLAPAATSIRDPHALLASEPYIGVEHSSWAGRLADGYLRQARIRPHERFELDGLDPIAVMVDRGLGVSLVPDWAKPWPEGLSLAKFSLPKNPFARRIGLVWNRTSVRARLVHAFLDEATAALAVKRGPIGQRRRPAPHRRAIA
jgi:DNA-binding transcriptional LysR family regulator